MWIDNEGSLQAVAGRREYEDRPLNCWNGCPVWIPKEFIDKMASISWAKLCNH